MAMAMTLLPHIDSCCMQVIVKRQIVTVIVSDSLWGVLKSHLTSHCVKFPYIYRPAYRVVPAYLRRPHPAGMVRNPMARNLHVVGNCLDHLPNGRRNLNLCFEVLDATAKPIRKAVFNQTPFMRPVFMSNFVKKFLNDLQWDPVDF
jgi:hypothetical protein